MLGSHPCAEAEYGQSFFAAKLDVPTAREVIVKFSVDVPQRFVLRNCSM
jgi:hypothetical protein